MEAWLPALPKYEFPGVGHTGGLCTRMRTGRRPWRFVFRSSPDTDFLSWGTRADSATGRGLVGGLGGLLASPHLFWPLIFSANNAHCQRLTPAGCWPNFGLQCGGVAQSGRARGSHPRGQGFEPPHLHQPNQQVTGSANILVFACCPNTDHSFSHPDPRRIGFFVPLSRHRLRLPKQTKPPP